MRNVERRIVSHGTARAPDGIAARLPRTLRPSVSVRIPGASRPIICRLGTSDLRVVEQIFVEQHDAVSSLPATASLVLDCGANIGASTLWLTERYPEARVLAVEPDPRNFWLLQRNVRHLGDRVRLVKGGVWSHATRLDLRQGHDGKSWSIRVVED